MGKPLLLFVLSLLLVCLFVGARVILPEHYDDSVEGGHHGLPVAEKTVETDAKLLLLPSQKETDVPNLPGTSVPESIQMDHQNQHQHRDFVTDVVDHSPNEETKLMNDFELLPTIDKPMVVDFHADDRFWMRIDPDGYYRHRLHHHHDRDFVTGVGADFPNKETEPMHGLERPSTVWKPIGVASHADDRLPMWINNADDNFRRHHHHHRDFVRGTHEYFRNQETKPMHDLERPSTTSKPMDSDLSNHDSGLPTSIAGDGNHRHHHDCHHHPHHHRVFVQGGEDYFRNEETQPMHDLERPSIAGKSMDASFPGTDGRLPTWMDGDGHFHHPHDHHRYEHPHRLKRHRFEKPKRKYHQYLDDGDDFEDDDNQKKGGGFFQWIGDLFHLD